MPGPIPSYAVPAAPEIQEVEDAFSTDLNEKDGENFNAAAPSKFEATLYARSVCVATARFALERAFDNANPLLAYETLPLLEREYQLVPGPTATLADRRSALAARMLLPLGGSYANVVAALMTLLGTDFKNFRTTHLGEATRNPQNGGDSPGVFTSPRTVIKSFTLAQTISINLGAPQWVYISPDDIDNPVAFIGDRFVVDPETRGLTESITVLAANAVQLNAVFNKAHSFGRALTTQPYPFWLSTQLHSLVVVTRACAENADKRRQINELMHRLVKGTASWDVVPDLDGSHTAPFTVGDTVLGRVGYAAVTSIPYP